MAKQQSNKHCSGYNRNYFKRLVKEHQEKLFEELCNGASSECPVSKENQIEVDPDLFSSTDTESNSSIVEQLSDLGEEWYETTSVSSDEEGIVKPAAKKRSLSDDLAGLVVKKRWPDRDVHDLLHVLNEHDVDQGNIPKTKAKLLSCPKEKIYAREIAGGSFYYYGIRKALLRRTNLLRDLDHIVLDIGIDGARIFHSSTLQIWPKIACVANCLNIRPFLIACYAGRKKAGNSEEFFQEFESELNDLYENGIEFEKNGTILNKRLSIRIFMMDSPARAEFCKIMSHGSYQGCPCCKFTEKVGGQKRKRSDADGDEKYPGKVIYSNKMGFARRTDQSFADREHPEHHKPNFRNNRSVLETLGFKMISQFPLDPMHIIDLGVVFKVLEFLIKMQSQRSHVIDIAKISERILAFVKYRPSDFAKDVRSLDYLNYFKATELRQFLLYGSIVFLKDLVDDHIYEHWLLLHVATRLLSSDSPTDDNINVAEILLVRFVDEFPSIYGADSITYVVHVLIHIPYFSRLYGSLDSFSCYKFENTIQKLKRYIGNAHATLEQIFNRMEEEEMYNKESYTIHSFNQTEIACNEKDCFVAFIKDGNVTPYKVTSIYEVESVKYFAANRCLNIENFYTSPMDSSDIGEITYESVGSDIEHFKSTDVVHKYCRIPYKDMFVLIPILHTAFRSFHQ